ncbi:MAG: sigma-70 family RNA polymerase sigma factor [Pseudomonadota bacterium]
MHSPNPVEAQITRLIREDWGRLLSVLTGFGGDLTLAEDCLQDAVVAALQAWPEAGVPKAPDAWLITTARRKAIDRLRRTQTNERNADALALWHWQNAPEAEELQTLPDRRLELIFTCCHPALDEKSQVALTLRVVGGLTTGEIAAAFLDKQEAMAARLTRAKKKIAAAGIRFRLPEAEDLPGRIAGILQVIYLIFNEGHRGSSDQLTRTDLAEEAIRLMRIMSTCLPDHLETKGLLALMLLTDARRLARKGPSGAFIPLEEQNRSRWDRGKIREGKLLVEQVLTASPPGPYTLQAAISALHAEAPDFASTDWLQIVALYDLLWKQQPNPVVLVNCAVAQSYATDPATALDQLEATGAGEHLQAYQPYHACRADLLARQGRSQEAITAYSLAIELTEAPEEAVFLQKRRNAVASIVSSDQTSS